MASCILPAEWQKKFLDLFLKYTFSSLVFICAIDLFSFLNADAVIT